MRTMMSSKKKSSSSSSLFDSVTNASSSAEKASASANKNTSSSFTADDEIIQLNVGGSIYTTRISTLTRVPGSFFESLFSNRFGRPTAFHETSEAAQEPATGSRETRPKSYFIDRDGKHFRHILNYLRCGTVVSLPPNDIGKQELATEADFYGLDDLLLAIQRPPLNVDENLPPEILKIQEEERKLRFKFAGNSNESTPLPLHAGLLSLFSAETESNDDGFEGISIECPLLFDAKHPLRQDRSCVYLSTVGVHNSDRAKHNQPVTVGTLRDFETYFNSQHPNILGRLKGILQTENVIIAGGSVLRALTGCSSTRTGMSYWDKNSDIDFFMYDMSSKQEANALVRRIFLALAVDAEEWVIMRCQGVINIHDRYTKIQIILRLYDSPTEVLIGFDVDCCGCCYTGSDVKMTKRCHAALVSGINVLNPLHAWPRKPSYELRLGKYAIRGFAVYVPGLPKDQIGYSEEIQKTELIGLKGIARFIKVDFEINSSNKVHYYAPHLPSRHDVRASTPREISSLRESVLEDLTPSELLLIGGPLPWGYDDDDELSPIRNVLVPDVYGEIVRNVLVHAPSQWQWFDHYFDISVVTRNKAIETILDCTDQAYIPDGIPKKLEDAWNLKKRSREYSNDAMEKTDVNMIYYSPIYEYCKVKTTLGNKTKL